MQTLAEQWKEILAHLKRLKDAKDAPDYRDRRKHRQHGVPAIVQTFARAEMRRRQHKG
jgi:hypothetical protein